MLIRPLTRADLSLILTWRNSEEVREYMYNKHIIPEKEHLRWFERMSTDSGSRWYVYQTDDLIPKGVVYFATFRQNERNAFWGFYIAPHSELGTETALAIDALDEAFSVLGIYKLNADVLAITYKSVAFNKNLDFGGKEYFVIFISMVGASQMLFDLV